MKKQSEQGLTLIEVLVSLAIFSIVSVAVLAMFPTIFKLNSQTRADQAVTVGAKQFMEQVRVDYADKTKDASGKTKFDQGALPTAPADSTVNGYTCTPSSVDQPVGTVTGVVRRVTLACTLSGKPTYTFVLDLGRPQ